MRWKGPYRDGVTFSMLSKFVTCRERFFIYACQGKREPRHFDHTMSYGTLFHGAEEYHRLGKPWQEGLEREKVRLSQEHPEQASDLAKWAALCRTQFPLYLKFYRNQDVLRSTHCCEQRFDYVYCLPSGRGVRLRGKIDSSFKSKANVQDQQTYSIQENKTKGKIDWPAISNTFPKFLQVQFYFLAFQNHFGFEPDRIIYNVIRRPLSEQYSVRQKKGESLKDFIKRACEKMTKEPHNYFYRANDTFRDTKVAIEYGLEAYLEQLCDWWDNSKKGTKRPGPRWHSQYPFGHFHSIAYGYRGDYHDFLSSDGRIDNLEDVPDYFPELKD